MDSQEKNVMWMGFLQDRKLVDDLVENTSLISYSFISHD